MNLDRNSSPDFDEVESAWLAALAAIGLGREQRPSTPASRSPAQPARPVMRLLYSRRLRRSGSQPGRAARRSHSRRAHRPGSDRTQPRFGYLGGGSGRGGIETRDRGAAVRGRETADGARGRRGLAWAWRPEHTAGMPVWDAVHTQAPLIPSFNPAHKLRPPPRRAPGTPRHAAPRRARHRPQVTD